MKQRIDRVVIVGGGTAGWIAANYMERWTRQYPGVRVTLIESLAIGTLGAGEGSTLALRGLFDMLDVDESDFLRQAKATFKLGIVFDNWRRGGDTYANPFSNLQDTIAMTDLNTMFDLLKLSCLASGQGDAVRRHTLQCRLMQQNKAPYVWYGDAWRNIEEVGQFDVDDPSSVAGYGYAYHFDARLLGKYLKKVALGRGVECIEGRVVHVDVDGDSGRVPSVRLEGGECIEGDFFIDASGFHRLMLGGVYGVKWRSYRSSLINNAALTFDLPRRPGDAIPCQTTATALSSGWMWQIPLQERTGCGYVYSRDFINPEQARREAEAVLGTQIEPRANLHFDPGRLEEHFVGNCAAVGLSSNFAEPLEASSIHVTIIQMHLLVNELTRDFDFDATVVVRSYNELINDLLDDITDYLALHYQTGRTDSPYWKHLQGPQTLPPRLHDLLELWRHRVPRDTDFPNMHRYAAFTTASYLYVLAGLKLIDPEIARAELSRHGLWDEARARIYRSEMTSRLLTGCAIDQAEYLTKVAGLPPVA